MSGFGPLRTEKLVLRPMAAEDAAELHRQWNDARVGRYLWDGQPVPRERVEEVVASSAATFAANGFGLWTASLLEDGRIAGFAGLRIEADTGRIELLYAFDPAVWGRGLATAAARAVLDDAFDRLRLPVVFAGTNPANEASRRVLERLDMRHVETRQTAVEPLLIYARQRPYDAGLPMSVHSFLPRLETQLDALPRLLGEASREALVARSPSGKWSAHENLAHIARQHEVFLGRLRRILAEDAPVLPQYRAEEDADWPAWVALPTDEVRRRLGLLRAELISAARLLSAADLTRTGRHARFGPMTVELWIEFFLVHEAHHLYTILRRARD